MTRYSKLILFFAVLSFSILRSTVSLAGTYTFEGTVYFPKVFDQIWDTNNDNLVGLPHAKIKIYDRDLVSSNVLATGETNADGFFNISFSYTGSAVDPDPDVIIKVSLENDRTKTHELLGHVYSYKTDKMANLAPGSYSMGIELSNTGNYTTASNIHATASWGIYQAYDVVGFPEYHAINNLFPSAIIDHSFNAGTSYLHKNDLTDSSGGISLVLHEMGHGFAYYQPNFGLTIDLLASPYGADQEHDWESTESIVTAFYEGWADFFNIYMEQELLTDPYRRFTSSSTFTVPEIETRGYNTMGDNNEGNVASALWDLTDDHFDQQIYFASSTQDRPIKDIRPWLSVSNLRESDVRKLVAVNSTYFFVLAKDTANVSGVYAIPRNISSSMSVKPKAQYVMPDVNAPYQDVRYIFLATDDYFYTIDYLNQLYRYPTNNITKQENFLGADSTFTHSFSSIGNINSRLIKLSYDSERKALYFYTPHDSTSYDAGTYKIDESTSVITRIGKAPDLYGNGGSDCLFFYQDKCYYFANASYISGTGYYSNQFRVYDPATDIHTDLFPLSNSSNINDPTQLGYFASALFAVADSCLHRLCFDRGVSYAQVIGSRLYVSAQLEPELCNIYEFDLTNQIFMRHAGNGTCGTVNAANLMSSFEDYTEIIVDTNGTYYYAFEPASPILRRVELDPANERVNQYCGKDELQIDVVDLYNTLDAGSDSILPYDGLLLLAYGGNHFDLLINNWINLSPCEIPMATENTSSSNSSHRSRTNRNETIPPYIANQTVEVMDATTYAPAIVRTSGGTDSDGDGIADYVDAFPTDAAESSDFDNDGTGNNADLDDDNDATPDSSDDFPYDPNEQTDTDEDGVGDNSDPN